MAPKTSSERAVFKEACKLVRYMLRFTEPHDVLPENMVQAELVKFCADLESEIRIFLNSNSVKQRLKPIPSRDIKDMCTYACYKKLNQLANDELKLPGTDWYSSTVLDAYAGPPVHNDDY